MIWQQLCWTQVFCLLIAVFLAVSVASWFLLFICFWSVEYGAPSSVWVAASGEGSGNVLGGKVYEVPSFTLGK